MSLKSVEDIYDSMRTKEFHFPKTQKTRTESTVGSYAADKKFVYRYSRSYGATGGVHVVGTYTYRNYAHTFDLGEQITEINAKNNLTDRFEYRYC
jgi:hypothetical protein